METHTPVSAILEHKQAALHGVPPDATVLEAVHLMNENKIGAVLVMEEGKPVGIFTERDVLVRVVDAGLDSAVTKVRDVMSKNLIVIKPTSTIEEAMRVVSEKRCRHLPVMNGDTVAGMISIGDLTRWIVREQDSYVENLLDYIYGHHQS